MTQRLVFIRNAWSMQEKLTYLESQITKNFESQNQKLMVISIGKHFLPKNVCLIASLQYVEHVPKVSLSKKRILDPGNTYTFGL